MKKYIYTVSLLTVVLFMTSCRKERDCKCTVSTTNTSNNTSSSSSQTTTSSGKLTKKEAKAWCEQGSATYTSGNYRYATSCELD